MKAKSSIFGAIGIAGLLLPMLVFAQVSATPTATPGVPPTGTVPPLITPSCPPPIEILRPGTTGDDVKALQSLLAQDPTVYPQGLVTGYFGPLTQEAVRKLQQQVGVAQTGIVDETTRPTLFPCIVLQVVSPNGGEEWKVGEVREITWDMATGDPQRLPAQQGTASPQLYPRPYFQNLTIDLVEYGRVVHRIGGASLYGDKSFKWTIPASIPESRLYKVRIALGGGNVPELLRSVPAPQIYPPVPWRGHVWDESDREFAILGGRPSISPVPTPTPLRPELLELRQKVAAMIEQLQKMLRLIDEILGRVPAL